MPRGRYSLPAICCLLLLHSVTWAGVTPRDLLSKMSHSFRELDYQGEFTYEYGSHMDTLHIAHAVRDGVEKERLVYMNGAAREVVRDGHDVSCVHPGDQIMRLGSTIASGPFARSFLGEHDIASHYTLSFGKAARVADRTVIEILVNPADQYRYGFRMFLDEETGLLLKSLTLSSSGKVLERFQFTRIEIGASIADDALVAHGDGSSSAYHHVLTQEGAASASKEPLTSAGWLPPGFALSARSQQAGKPYMTQLSMYTDGFSSLTLVLEPVAASVAPVRDGKARRGATVAYMRRLSIAGEPYLLTVVGEVPLVTAQKVAQSVTVGQG